MDNQQMLVEHIVNIDTVAQHIDTVDAVAVVAGQIAAVAGMLPDIAATAQARATIIALSKKLMEIEAVADALPLLHALQAMTGQVTAVIALRPELAAVVGQMSAIQRLAAEIDVLVQAPEHAASAKSAAELAETAAMTAEVFAGKADAARLGAEFAENEAKAARNFTITVRDEAKISSDEARKSAAAAAAVSGLPDAAQAAPGAPLIWSGTAFAVGKLAESLLSAEGTLAVAPAVLASIDTARVTADGAVSTATLAQADAASAKATAEGVDGKATQAAADAHIAKATADAVEAQAGGFDARISATEKETSNVGLGLGAHAADANLHTPLADIEAVAEAAANRLKDGVDGSTLPADRATLLALSQLMDTAQAELSAFLDGADPGQRLAILTEIDRLAAEFSNTLSRADVVNDLTTGGQDVPLSAAQGQELKLQLDGVRGQAEAAVRPWITIVSVMR